MRSRTEDLIPLNYIDDCHYLLRSCRCMQPGEYTFFAEYVVLTLCINYQKQ